MIVDNGVEDLCHAALEQDPATRTAFLMIKAEPTAAPPEVVLVQHFDEELKRFVPTK